MNQFQRSQNIKSFVKEWSGSDYKEKGNVGKFWIELLEQVFNVDNASKYIDREVSVPNMKDSTDFIDAYIPSTRVLIEQKAPYLPLDKPEQRSFGYVTPFEQAKHYDDNLPLPKKAKWIITCNFHEFWIYDMSASGTHPKPTKVFLSTLWRYYYQLDFLIDPTRQDIKKETKVSVHACNIINDIYHQLLKQYDHPDNPKVLRDVNKICVRLVFCLYADDSGIFGHHEMFHNYMKNIPSSLWNMVLNRLFTVLNTPLDKRHNDQLDAKLAKFPYVNGGMFADNPADHVEIPNFTESIAELVLNAGDNFDWSQISPTIFGALFESTLNPEERHTNGMHYTSVQNIHKVIDPLFLNQLRHELNVIKTKYKSTDAIHHNARIFQNKLASLTFFDPACGSGNFLTETYLCLRKLENEAIKLQLGSNGQIQTQLGLGQHIIQVSIHQFYGIEINDFAVSVAKTAMWIAESQMVQETQNIINQPITFLPLKSNPNITEANALEVNWNKLVNANHLNYIISNPPFVGDWRKDKKQKEDINTVLKDFKQHGQLDYVACWYKKSADMMDINPRLKTVLVSTNSISQGQQVPLLWKPLLNTDGLHINFAYRSFKWSNSTKHSANVICVIIAFSHINNQNKVIYKNIDGKNVPTYVKSGNISPYLMDMPNFFIKSRPNPICNVHKAVKGNQPTDHGLLSKYTNSTKTEICNKYPRAKDLFKRLCGAREFLHNKVRWCLWLDNVPASKWLNIKPVRDAVKQVRAYRLKSSKKATRKSAMTPSLFQEIRQPNSNYLLIPSHSSQNRRYVPVGYMDKDVIMNNSCLFIPNANHYLFGIIESNLSTIWIKLVSGRLKNDIRYSDKVTYNNFPFLRATNKQKETISKTAKGILLARANHKDESLADLYSPLAMPPDLLKAHQANDRAVLKAYGLKSNATKNEIITKLLKMYLKLTKK